MSDALVHRGPDESGEYRDRGLAFVFRRLRIIDLVTGGQPMTNEDGSVAAMLNGEIYNFGALRPALERKHRFRTRSDTEVLIHLYEEYGEGAVDHLNGMFAFVVWDRRRDVLLCARDRAGQKPFYYGLADGAFVFASEPKAILRAAADLGALDAQALAKYLAFEYVPPPATLYRGIRQLPPAHILTVRASGELHLRRYWSVTLGRPQSPRARRTDAEVAESVRAAFRSAVERHLVSDVPVGAFLSGGIDSSSVVAAMARLRSGPELRTYSVKFDEPGFDESEYVGEVAGAFGTQHSTLRVTAADVLRAMGDLAGVLDEPFGDPSVVTRYLVSRFAKNHVTVVLTGDGGDELFAGYPTFLAHKAARWLLPGPSARLRPLVAAVARVLPASKKPFGPAFVLRVLADSLGHAPEIMNQIWLGSFTPDAQRRLLHPAMQMPLGTDGVYSELREHAERAAQDRSDVVNRILSYYFQFYLPYDLAKVDRASMAASVETRSPFLDRELVDHVLALGPEHKVRRLTLKHALKAAMRSELPSRILTRPKRGFTVPIGVWLRSELKTMVTDLLSPAFLRRQGIFDASFVERLVREHMRGERDHRRQLWSLLAFNTWYGACQRRT